MIVRNLAPGGRYHRHILVTFLLVLTVVGFAVPGQYRIGSLNFFNAEITLVLKSLADLSGANIVIGPAVKGAITIRLKDVTVEQALNDITKMAGLVYTVSDGAYFINTPDALHADVAADEAHAVITPRHLAPADIISALGIAYRDVQAKELVGRRVVLSGRAKRLESALAFIKEIDVLSTAGGAPEALPADQTSLVVALKAVGQTDVSSVLAAAYKDVQVTALPDHKKVMLTGERSRVNAAKALLDEIDVPSATPLPGTLMTMSNGQVEKNYIIKNVIPWQAKQYVEDLFQGQNLVVVFAPVGGYLGTNDTAPPSTAASDPKTGTAGAAGGAKWESHELILRGAPALVDSALESLAKIDIEVPLLEKRCAVKHIFPTQAIAYLYDRYNAKGLVIMTAPMTPSKFTNLFGSGKDIMSSVNGATQVGTVVRMDKTGKLNISEPIGDIILRGPEEVVTKALASVAEIDVGPDRAEQVVSLRYLLVSDAKKQLEDLYGRDGLQVTIAPGRRGDTPTAVTGAGTSANGGSSGGGAASSSSDQGEVYDLVLRGPDTVVATAVQMITSLDTEPAQISIKAEIVSINSSELENLGVQWGGVTGGTNTPGSLSTNLSESQTSDPLQLGRIVRDPLTLNMTLNALQTKSKAKVVNRPASVVKNGRVATIHVGRVTYYETLTGYDTTGKAIYSTSSLNTGITLQVRPLVSPDGVITLEIASDVAEDPQFTTGVSGAQLPTFNESSSTTVVEVRDNETLVIGGLMQNSQTETEQNVPVLSRLPLFGHLFANKETNPHRQELLILVTPHIIAAGSGAAPAAAIAPSAK